MKRKIERMLVLFLAIMILAVTIETAETIWPANQNNKSENREPKMRVRAESLPNDPYWSLQWGLKKIEADWAWNATFGNSSILVAVIDSGIDYNHPDLAANYAGLGYDWINNDEDPMDDFNHGTRVAGIIAAQINNGIGIAGLAQVKIMAEKVLDNTGSGYVDQLADGIYHATDQGANIISMSLSTEYNGSLLYDPIKYAYERNVLLVAAAGNEESDAKRYPAAYDEVIAVTATNENDQIYPLSNYGDWIELAAPGVNIYSTIRGGGYDYWSGGTSFACPYVSGLAALVWSEFPNATRDWIRIRLRETADDLGTTGFDNDYGYGRINARKAIYGTSPAINYTLVISTTLGGTTNPAPGNYTYSERQNVSVQAISDTGYALDYWELDGSNVGSTNPYSVLMDNNHTLHAVFELLLTYRLTILSSTGGTTDPMPGNYTYYSNGTYTSVTAIPDMHYLLDYWLLDGDNLGSSNPVSVLMTDNHTLQPVFVYDVGINDIAITNVTSSKTVAGQGYNTSINVTVANQGTYTETFNVTVYVNTTSIATQTVTLSSGNSTTITFTWNTADFAKGNYTISAYAWPIPGETDASDNTFMDGMIYVGIPGDINGDFIVDIYDAILLAGSYNSIPGSPNWKPNADINSDNIVDIYDAIILANHYNQHYP